LLFRLRSKMLNALTVKESCSFHFIGANGIWIQVVWRRSQPNKANITLTFKTAFYWLLLLKELQLKILETIFNLKALKRLNNLLIFAVMNLDSVPQRLSKKDASCWPWMLFSWRDLQPMLYHWATIPLYFLINLYYNFFSYVILFFFYVLLLTLKFIITLHIFEKYFKMTI